MTRTMMFIYLGVAALVAVVGYLFITRGASLGFAVGKAAVDTASGVVGGVVTAGGSIIGIPLTDKQKCAASQAANDYWGISINCTASEFFSWGVK